MYPFIQVERTLRVDALYMALDVVRPRDFYFPGESHDFWELVYVREGRATATADARVYHLSEGMLLFHKPMEFHRIWSEGDTCPHLMIISFKASGEDMEKLRNSCFALEPRQRKRFEEAVAAFCNVQTLRGEGNGAKLRRAVSQTAVLLENFLMRLTEQEDQLPHESFGEDAQYTKIVNVMQENCHRSLTLEELAKECGMSVSNMKRIFSRFSDMGIAKYFLGLKMRKAMAMLEAEIPASRVAELLDFSEINYFYTVFKRETGMTPTQYKRSRSG
jgi:AraC-like DNA-binding protein